MNSRVISKKKINHVAIIMEEMAGGQKKITTQKELDMNLELKIVYQFAKICRDLSIG